MFNIDLNVIPYPDFQQDNCFLPLIVFEIEFHVILDPGF